MPNSRFESLTVLSPDDFAALDICYTAGDEVQEQASSSSRSCGPPSSTRPTSRSSSTFATATAASTCCTSSSWPRAATKSEKDEMLDPGAVLLVLDALARLTGGVAIDPQSGTLL